MSNMVCKVCGSTYSYCPGCVKDMHKPRWMASFDKEDCKKVFDALVANSSGKMSDSEALGVVEKSGVKITSNSIKAHVDKLKGGHSVNAVPAEPKKEDAPAPIERKEEEQKPLFSNEHKDVQKNAQEEKHDKGLGSLFGKNNNFSSNSKNKEKVKQDAGSIASAIDQLDKQQGFSGL